MISGTLYILYIFLISNILFTRNDWYWINFSEIISFIQIYSEYNLLGMDFSSPSDRDVTSRFFKLLVDKTIPWNSKGGTAFLPY